MTEMNSDVRWYFMRAIAGSPQAHYGRHADGSSVKNCQALSSEWRSHKNACTARLSACLTENRSRIGLNSGHGIC